MVHQSNRFNNVNTNSTETENLPSEDGGNQAADQKEDAYNGIQDDLYHSLQVTPKQLKSWQESDPSLEKLREAAKNPQEGYTATFFFKQGLLYCRWIPKGRDRQETQQLVLPIQCHSIVLRIGHDVPAAGHMGANKTRSRILCCYYILAWDIPRYCSILQNV